MICKQCKQKISKGVQFCPNCGSPIEKKEKTPLTKSFFVFWIEVLLVAALIFGLTKAVAFSFGPEKILNKYAKAILEDNWQEAFSCMDMGGADFFSEEGYKKAVYTKISADSDSYTLEKKRDKGDTITYQINFTSSGTASGQITVGVNKMDEKELFFFPTWKIDSSGNTISNVVFYVPVGTDAYLDGAKVSDEYLATEEADASDTDEDDFDDDTDFDNQLSGKYNKFVIPKLYVGIHHFSCGLNGNIMDECNQDVETDGDVVTLQNVVLTPEMQQEIASSLYESYLRYETALVQGQDFASISDMFYADSEYYTDLEEDYNYDRSRSYAVNGLSGNVQYDFYEMAGLVNEFSYDSENGCICADVTLGGKYNYVSRYTYTYRWEVEDEVYEDYEFTVNATMVRGADGTWKISYWRI